MKADFLLPASIATELFGKRSARRKHISLHTA